MSNTNYISAIVKVLETPVQQVFNKNIPGTQFRVQLPQIRKNTFIHLKCWGKLSQDIVNYYNINDYIIIEGYLSFQEDRSQENKIVKKSKKVEITVLKIYPFILSYPQQNTDINYTKIK